MRLTITLLLYFTAFLVGCKPNLPNKEAYLKVVFESENQSLKSDSLFYEVLGLSGDKTVGIVKYQGNAVYLPLDMNSKQCNFYFSSWERRDTITVYYETTVTMRSSEYFTQPTNLRIISSFKKTQLNCKNANAKNCIPENLTVSF